MHPIISVDNLETAYQTALAALLAERTPEGHWVGELSTSALSTATAITALALVQKNGSPGQFNALIAGGLSWLVEHQNDDGGWGDTTKSLSNISTSMLVCATFALLLPPSPLGGEGLAVRGKDLSDFEEPPSPPAPLPRGERGGSPVSPYQGERETQALSRLEAYLDSHCGKSVPERAEAIRRRYGKDRTFAVPILTMCAIAGLVPWTEVPPLPFELACFPQSWFRFFRLPVVSYALPALIAIGQAIHHHRPSWNPVTALIRRLARAKSLRVLQSIQPSSGGFLEATPLTSFVTMSLASIGQADHAVARKGVEFIVNSVRPDGSWPIDTNLATWVTTLSINALAAAGEVERLDHKEAVCDWLLKQQFKTRHPYTGADPGGWGWTDLPGSVPDCDDTPGALLAVRALLKSPGTDPVDELLRSTIGTTAISDLDTKLDNQFSRSVQFDGQWGKPGFHVLAGLGWLFHLKNRDDGWPTFCRGWGNLPFDRSGTDLTAHALRAISAWSAKTVSTRVLDVLTTAMDFRLFIDGIRVDYPSQTHFDRAVRLGLAYLARTQRPDGSWLPLWFGNQHAPDDENPTYGTARVLAAYRDLDMMGSEPARRGVAWLLGAQNGDGGWGGAKGVPSSIEETALAVEVLLDVPDRMSREGGRLEVPREANLRSVAVQKGLTWLVQQVESGGLSHPTPIGFYFAKLWYYEKLYPIIFAVAALGRARRMVSDPPL